LTISPISTFSKNENKPNLTQFEPNQRLDCGDMSRRSKAQSCLRTPKFWLLTAFKVDLQGFEAI
jgi:hypothetical protein